MARPHDSERYDLSDAEKRDLIKLIEQGKPLVLAFEFEMGLFPAVLDETKQKDIDLAPKTIPPEVFDARSGRSSGPHP